MNTRAPQTGKAVAWWLITGVVMIMIQILIGGITRLTESGLSITEWKPITGMLPPLTEAAWAAEFEKYKQIDQFKYLHSNFTLSDFKYIFFWEWFHRFWARLIGIVFIIGFVWFLAKKQFKQDMVLPLVVLFLIGALQGAIGWVMVKSGLVPEKFYVGHVELATHFVAAIVLLVYTLWFALPLIVSAHQQIHAKRLYQLTWFIILIVFVQLTYGAFMAGLKAATVAPTWPTINGAWFPESMYSQPEIAGSNWVNNPIMVHFMHRGIAYFITILIIVWFVQSLKQNGSSLFRKVRKWPFILVFTQVILGILTVVYSPSNQALIWFGVLHQFVAMLLVIALVVALYLLNKSTHR